MLFTDIDEKFSNNHRRLRTYAHTAFCFIHFQIEFYQKCLRGHELVSLHQNS